MKRIKQRGLTKKEERLGWITRGHEQQATSAKPQAPSTKHQASSFPAGLPEVEKK